MDRPAAGFDAGSHNRQPQTHATRLPLARVLGAIERFEHGFEFAFGNARPLFGKPNSLAAFGPPGGGNRIVDFTVMFSF